MSSPIRVLQVVGNMGAGGLETLIMNWYRKIDRSKVQFDFLVHNRKKSFYEDEIIALGGKVYHCSFLDDKNYFEYKKFLKEFFLKHREYTIIHGHHSSLGSFYLKSASQANIPIRISHSHIASYSKSLRGIAKYIIRLGYGKYANKHFACSRAAGHYMYGKNADFTVINNGIDTDKFVFSAEERARVRSELALGDRIVAIHVGRFFDQKNHSFLIDIFEELHKKEPDAVLILLGVGPLQDEIKKKVTEFGLSDAVLFMNNRDNVQDYLSAADVFIFPSLYEGLPLTLVEAQASGLPIVCSDTITDETKLTEHYDTLSLRDTAKTWAEHSLAAIDRDRLRVPFAAVVKEKKFDSTGVAEQMQELYLSCYQQGSD